MRPNEPKRVAHPCSKTYVLCNGTHCLLLLLLLPWSCCIHLTWNRDTFSFQQKKKSKTTTAAKLKSENLKNWRYKFFITIIIIVIRCNKARNLYEKVWMAMCGQITILKVECSFAIAMQKNRWTVTRTTSWEFIWTVFFSSDYNRSQRTCWFEHWTVNTRFLVLKVGVKFLGGNPIKDIWFKKDWISFQFLGWLHYCLNLDLV